MSNTRSEERAMWVIHREYTDSQGNVRVEYRDAEGVIHTELKTPSDDAQSYQQGYIAGQTLEEEKQDEQIRQGERDDKNISQGLLLGVVAACVVGLGAGIIYLLVNSSQPQPATVINVPQQQASPVPSPPTPPPVVRQPGAMIVPVPSAQPQGAKANVTTRPAAPKPAVKAPIKASPLVTKPTVIAPIPNSIAGGVIGTKNEKPTDMPTPSVANDNVSALEIARRDRDLKNEILRTLQDRFSDNQLIVDVNKADVVVSGSVETPEQLQQIKPLLLSIQDIGKIEIKVTVKKKSN